MKPNHSWPYCLRVAAVASLAFLAGTGARADSAYQSAVLADGPLTYHRFSETGVAPVALPVATNSGTLGASANATPFSLLHESPIVLSDPGPLSADSSQTAYTFPGPVNNGNVNSLQVPWQDTLAQNAAFTVEVWCKPASADYRNVLFSMMYVDPAGDTYGWELRQRNGNGGNGWQFISWGGADGNAGAWNVYNMTVTPGTWYHVVAVQTAPDGSGNAESKLYVNGALVDDETLYGYLPNPNPAFPMNIGSLGQDGSTPNREFAGSLAEVVYYTNVLSDAEVLNHYNGAATMTAAQYAAMILAKNPPGYWKLNERPVTLPVAVNSGSGGAAFNAKYESGSTTVASLAAPTYPGLETTNRVLSLDSSQNGFVSIPPLNSTLSSATFECLFNPNGWQETYAGLILHRDDRNAATHGLTYDAGGALSYTWNWAANTYNWFSGLYPTPGQWSYAAVSISPTQAKMYLFDGTTWQVAVNSVAHGPGTFDLRTAIGQDDDNPGTRNFNGLLDEAAIYNKALTEGQLRSHALAAFATSVAPQFVLDPPTVTPSATVMAGASFALSSDAYGTPPLAYQWRHAGTNIPGATVATYAKSNANLADSGDYQVVVANPSGSITGSPVALTVASLPPNTTNDLRLWLKLDASSGLVAADSSTNSGVSGTLMGFPGDTTQWVPGAMGNAVRFNPPGSAGEYVDVTDSRGTLEFSAGQEFSVSVWVKASPSQTSGAGIVAKGEGSGGEQFALDVNGGAYRFYVRDASANATVFQTAVAPNNNWQHLVAAFSGPLGMAKVYVDGAEVVSGTPPSTLQYSAHDVTIGARQSGYGDYDFSLNATIDDVRIYGRMVSAGDVMMLYTNALPIRLRLEQEPQPASRAVLPGGTVTFSAVVSGVPLACQWQLDGVNVPGATNATLVVANVDSTKTGSYTLIAANSLNSVTSSPPVTVSLLPMAAIGYAAGVVADKPESYWRLDETSAGTVWDAMGRHDGNLYGSVSLSQPGVVTGDSDTCMAFSSGYVQVPNSPALNTGVFSIECWAQYQGPSPVSDYYCPVSSIAWGNSGYLIYAAANGLWETWLGGSSSSWLFNGSSQPVTSAWTHLVSTCDGTHSALYVNGTLAATAAVPPGTFVQNSTMPLAIGWNDAVGGYYFRGPIDEVAFYQSALSPERVKAHYQLALAGTSSQPIFVTEPVSQTVQEGAPVSFSPVVAGASPMSYQWKQGGLNVTTGTAQTLAFASVEYTNAGQYTLAATNSYGGVVSAAATLTVLPPASVTNLTARFSHSPTGPKLELVWPLGYTLYCATNVAAPSWLPVAGATAPYYNVPISTSIPQLYFKIQ